jgi:hypothetical protein
MIPRIIIDEIFEVISNNDLIDKWNFPVNIIRDYDLLIKSGNSFNPVSCFSSNNKFIKFNNLTPEKASELFTPVLQKYQNELTKSAISELDNFIIKLKAQIQTTHAKFINNNNNPLEDIGRQIVSAAVFGFFEREGFVYHEVQSGKGLIDILICTNIEVIIEAKLSSNFNSESKQLDAYVLSGHNRRGYYFVFDVTQKNLYKKYCDIENNRFPQKNRNSIVVCHINPPRPSSI